jgi:hypothetical protein
MSKIVQYGAYTIKSVPVKQTRTENWKLEITISWEDDRAENRRDFSSADPPYHSEEEADLHGIALGQLITDGKIPRLPVN